MTGNPVYLPLPAPTIKWSLARKLAVSRLPEAASLIPIIGYAVLFSDWFKSGFEKLWIAHGATQFPVEARLLCLWWGAVLMFAGWSLYKFACPAEIQKNRDADAYALEQRLTPSVLRLIEARNDGDSVIQSFHPSDTTKLIFGKYSPNDIYLSASMFVGTAGNIGSDATTFSDATADHRDRLFRLQYEIKDSSRVSFCLISNGLLFGGAAVFLSPAMHSAGLVILYTAKRMLLFLR